ncbi:hybrid sensor histidine kinase/response regulator [Phenylobacterium kunshanense]|nr:ATP-binding protein [Phenylobacterium kunshanense]
MALAIAAALIVLAGCGALIWYSGAAVDRLTEARETRLMERVIARRESRLRDELASVAVWSDAYDRTARDYDPEWAQINYGDYFHPYMGHDLSLVFDAGDRVIYASVDGATVDPRSLAPFARAAVPLAANARRATAEKISRNPDALGFDRFGAAEAALKVGDQLFIAGAATIVPEPEYERPLLVGPETVVVTAIKIGPTYLASLEADYGLKAARLLPPGSRTRPAVTLTGPGGEIVGRMAWKPERPGVGVYRNAAWEIAGVGAMMMLLVAVVVLRVRGLAEDVVRERDRAEAGDRAKSDFIANMSHEIRTPLNGVLGMAQVMEAHDLSPDQRGRLRVIRESGATLLSLLNDVLDLSKIEAGKLEIVEAPFRVDELTERVCGTFAGVAAAKNLALDHTVDPTVAGVWIGDGLRLRQVLSNLVSNAVKFTDQGRVALAVDATPRGVRFVVSDTGIGIERSKLPKLFSKFAQADASTTRRYGGTGLGLAISHRLVQMMGGTIEATSRPGEGSIFTVVMPLRRSAGEIVRPPPPPPVETPPAFVRDAPLRVLAAEDNATNQLVLRALLEPLGAEVTMVADGLEAVEAFSRGAFDVVLMDVQMPRMNGLDATQAIRELEARRGGPTTPILALTANVMSHQIESYLDAGMDGHIAKPLDLSTFYGALDEVLSAGASDREAASA